MDKRFCGCDFDKSAQFRANITCGGSIGAYSVGNESCLPSMVQDPLQHLPGTGPADSCTMVKTSAIAR